MSDKNEKQTDLEPTDNNDIIQKDQRLDQAAKKKAIRNTSVLGVSDEEQKKDVGNGLVDVAENPQKGMDED